MAVVPSYRRLGEAVMKKYLLAAVAVLAVLSVAGCVGVGKAPIGKGPVVTKY